MYEWFPHCGKDQKNHGREHYCFPWFPRLTGEFSLLELLPFTQNYYNGQGYLWRELCSLESGYFVFLIKEKKMALSMTLQLSDSILFISGVYWGSWRQSNANSFHTQSRSCIFFLELRGMTILYLSNIVEAHFHGLGNFGLFLALLSCCMWHLIKQFSGFSELIFSVWLSWNKSLCPLTNPTNSKDSGTKMTRIQVPEWICFYDIILPCFEFFFFIALKTTTTILVQLRAN